MKYPTGKVIGLLFAAVIITTAVVWTYTQGQINLVQQQAYSEGFAAGQASTPAAVTPVALTITQTEGSTFDLSANVSSDGSATAVTKELAFTIANMDNKSATVLISLKDPKTGSEGLPSGLKNAYFNVYVKENGQLKYLYTSATYTDGKKITIDPASVVTLYVGVSLETAPAGTFADNQTYTMNMYIYQPDANYVQSTSYTILT